MKEASYNSLMAAVLVQTYGGKCIKLFNPTTLGLPDTLHIKDGLATFFEIKIGDKKSLAKLKGGIISCRPWDSVNDIRQFRTCESLDRFAPVIYVIYYPDIKMTAVIPMPIMEIFEDNQNALLKQGDHFVKGHGIGVIVNILNTRRRMVYEAFNREFGISPEGIS